MAKDVLITPASGLVEFKDTAVLKGSVYESSGDIYVNSISGTVVLGSGTPADVQVGAVGSTVNLTFLGGGSIAANTSTLNIGASGDTVSLTVPGVTYNFPTTLMRTSDYTAADVLTKIKTVDGTGSGLDADLLDGKNTGTSGNVIPTLDGANTWSAVQTHSKAYYFSTQTLTDGATISWDASSAQVAVVTLGGNRTMAAPTNLANGAIYSLGVYQDATGSRTLTWNSVFKWNAGTAPTLSSGANSKNFFMFMSDGTNLYEMSRSLGVA